MSLLHFGLDVLCQFEARVPEFDQRSEAEVWSLHGGERIGSSVRNQLLSPCSIMCQVLVVANSKLVPHRE